VRRRAQLFRLRPDLNFVELRGNIPTRLEKIPENGAIVMAAAALDILGWSDRVSDYVSVDDMVPAVGQGCVAVECRTEDDRTRDLLGVIDHRPSRLAVERERSFLAELGSGCSLPVGAFDDGLTMRVYLASDDGTQQYQSHITTGDSATHDELLESARGAARTARSSVTG